MDRVITRADATTALVDIFKVDLTDFTHASYPDGQKRHAAVVVIELQLEIMRAVSKGDHCAARIAAISAEWRGNHNLIQGYALEMAQLADRILTLIGLRNLAIVPFRKEFGS